MIKNIYIYVEDKKRYCGHSGLYLKEDRLETWKKVGEEMLQISTEPGLEFGTSWLSRGLMPPYIGVPL